MRDGSPKYLVVKANEACIHGIQNHRRRRRREGSGERKEEMMKGKKKLIMGL